MRIMHYGKQIDARETTSLTISGLAQYFGVGRQTIYDDFARGYAPLYGTTTTPRHYRTWLAANPRLRRSQKALAAASKLEHELSQLH